VDKLQESSNFALVKFEKTTHTSLEQLRKELKKNDAKLQVVKNRLFQKAVNRFLTTKKSLYDIHDKDTVKENSAVLFLKNDWNNALKAFHEFSKKEKTVSFKIGHLDDKVYKKSELEQIAQLPSRPELIAKLIGGMKSPMVRVTRSMKFNMQKFVVILNEKAKQG
jgi:large subunit ribosomal protein L10